MEGYTENGAGTDVTDQIGFAGMRRKKKQRRGLSVFQLKVIGAVALVLSAGSTTLVPLIFGSDTSNMTSLTAMVLCEVVSWFAAPIYAWLLVQGFQQTRNRVAYGVQLLLLALIAEVPYDLATSGKPFDFGSQNPVFVRYTVLARSRRAFCNRSRQYTSLAVPSNRRVIAHVRLAAGFPKSIGQKRAIVFLGK